MSSGTSNPIFITGEAFSARRNPQFSPVEGVSTSAYGKVVEVKPPEANADTVSKALSINRNAFETFTFEKISVPEYGVEQGGVIPIGHYTGIPVNRPDYINDYFFISIMRSVDKLVNPSHQGRIKSIYDTPGPQS